MPANRKLKMPVLRVKTKQEIDAEWEHMFQFYSQFDGLSTGKILSGHLKECEALQICMLIFVRWERITQQQRGTGLCTKKHLSGSFCVS